MLQRIDTNHSLARYPEWYAIREECHPFCAMDAQRNAQGRIIVRHHQNLVTVDTIKEARAWVHAIHAISEPQPQPFVDIRSCRSFEWTQSDRNYLLNAVLVIPKDTPEAVRSYAMRLTLFRGFVYIHIPTHSGMPPVSYAVLFHQSSTNEEITIRLEAYSDDDFMQVSGMTGATMMAKTLNLADA